MRVLIIFFCVFNGFINPIIAQFSAPLNGWGDAYPYRDFYEITESEDEVFFRSRKGVIAVDKMAKTRRKISSVNQLNNSNLTSICYAQQAEYLMVGYADGYMDLVADNQTLFIPDIAESGTFINRRINDIVVDKPTNIAYISTGFGLVLYDLNTFRFLETVLFDMPVEKTLLWNGNIFVQTEDDIRWFENGNIQSLSDWNIVSELIGYELSIVFEDKIYVHNENEVFAYDGNNVETYFTTNSQNIIALASTDNRLIILTNEGNDSYFYESTNIDQPILQRDCFFRAFDIYLDDADQIWVAVQGEYVVRKKEIDSDCERFFFDGPYDESTYRMQFLDDKLWVTSGSLQDNYNFSFNRDGIYMLDPSIGDWKNFHQFSKPSLASLFDYYEVAHLPSTNTTYVSTYSNGLIQINNIDSNFIVLDDSNSELKRGIVETSRVLTAGLAVDDNENLWIANTNTEDPLVRLSKEGDYQRFGMNGRRDILDVLVDDFGNIWATLIGTDAGVMVMNPGDLEVNGDEKYRIFRASSSVLTSNRVNHMVNDEDGNIWLSTSDGVVIMECSFDPFDANCDFSLRVVDENDFDDENSNLFNDEWVTGIAVDGANRKWVGTRNGVFLLSESGREQLLAFTTANSPLPNNEVNTIAIDENNGTVFIGTSDGIVAYGGTASKADAQHTDVVVYPNPVTPDYMGNIAIKGLANEALVYITEPNGRLVYKGFSNGGFLEWNGRDYKNQKVAPGVYIIMSSNENLNIKDTAVGKLLIMRD